MLSWPVVTPHAMFFKSLLQVPKRRNHTSSHKRSRVLTGFVSHSHKRSRMFFHIFTRAHKRWGVVVHVHKRSRVCLWYDVCEKLGIYLDDKIQWWSGKFVLSICLSKLPRYTEIFNPRILGLIERGKSSGPRWFVLLSAWTERSRHFVLDWGPWWRSWFC